MLHQEFKPPEELRDTIKCFWYNRRDFDEHQPDFEVLPDGYAEIIFHFGGNCCISSNGNLQPLPSPFVMGLLNQPITININARFEIIAVRCFPWTVFDLLGLPSGKGGVHLHDHPVARLQSTLEKFVYAGQIDAALAQLERYFLHSRSQVGIDTMLFKAGVAMQQANGSMPVSEVAAAAHATVRTLERKFRHSSGHTVKDVSGLMRFEQVRNRLWLHPDSSLAGMAQEFGFTDQSHLSREFKRYSGTTPASFARKAKKEQQSAGENFGAFIQS